MKMDRDDYKKIQITVSGKSGTGKTGLIYVIARALGKSGDYTREKDVFINECSKITVTINEKQTGV